VNFAQPVFLWGMLAALIPLLVHLFDRRRPRRVPFAAIAFVLKSQKRTASRLRLKKLLLYLSRTAMLLVLPLALSQPSCSRQATVTQSAALSATVLLVDVSFATRVQTTAGRLFERVQREAKQALARVDAQEPVALLPCAGPLQPSSLLNFDRLAVARAIDELRPSFEPADYNQCLSQAARMLEDSPLPGRRIVLVGAPWTQSLHFDQAAPKTTDSDGKTIQPQLVLQPVLKDEAPANLSVSSLFFERAPQGGPRVFQFVATVSNFGLEAVAHAELQLLVDNVTVSKAFVDVAAGASAQKVLTFAFAQGGTQRVSVRLADDALNEDNAREVLVAVPKEAQVLLVNGAPNAQKLKDEAFFVEAALAENGSPVRAVQREPAAAWSEGFDKYAAVFLLNVEPPPTEVAQQLAAYVKAGGGLFVSFGDRLTAENGSAWSALLPRGIRVTKTAVEPGAADSAASPAHFLDVSVMHPLLEPFIGKAREGLMATRFYRYALFENAEATDVLATLDDGAPVLWTASQSKGRMLVFASSLDTDWTDFPIRTAFLPFVQRAAAFLTGALEEQERVEGRVGQKLTLSQRAPSEAVAALTPSEVRMPIERIADSPASLGPFREPGLYALVNEKESVLESWRFPVQLASSAGDVSLAQVDNVKSWFGAESVEVFGSKAAAPSTPLLTWLLTALVVAFIFEGLLLTR
jgi:hypothetical protein